MPDNPLLRTCFSSSIQFLLTVLPSPRCPSEVLSAAADLDRERRRNGSVFKITAEFTAALEADGLVFSFCLDIRSLLRGMIGGRAL